MIENFETNVQKFYEDCLIENWSLNSHAAQNLHCLFSYFTISSFFFFLLFQVHFLHCLCCAGGGYIRQGEFHFRRASGWGGSDPRMQGLKQSSYQLVCFHLIWTNKVVFVS